MGKNMMIYEFDQKILVVDCGIMFPENDMLGIDYIIPDFNYVIENKHRVVGIVITHGHEDHTGAITHLVEAVKAPIYATTLTRGLLEVKLSRGGLINEVDMVTVKAGQTVQIGPFKVEFFHVCHSIPDSVGLGITTPAGLVVHSGDYKFDQTPVDNWPTDFAKLAEFSARGVDILLSDSTNADKRGWTPSERVIDPAFDQVFREANGRIIIASFASLISRMQQVATAAERHNRKLSFVGASMTENYKMARKLGYLDIHDDVVVPLDQALKLKPSEVVLMCTGTQGEPTSIMGRLSTGTNRQFELIPGDTVVLSSHPIPGNEESVYRTINRLFRRGATVIYEAVAPVHVSGHASQEEMKLLLNLVKPRNLIPIHGELRHLNQHKTLGREVGIPADNIVVAENGQVIELCDGEMRLGERIPGGYIFVDGSGVGDVSNGVVREREMLGREGFFIVSLRLDRATGRLHEDPEIITRGFIQKEISEALINDARKRIIDTVSRGNGSLQDDLEQMLKSFLFNETRRRPTIVVTLNRG